jgi:hypothetical protein
VLRSNKETGSWEACCPATARARYSSTVLRLTPSSRAIARALALPRNGVAATPVHVHGQSLCWHLLPLRSVEGVDARSMLTHGHVARSVRAAANLTRR